MKDWCPICNRCEELTEHHLFPRKIWKHSKFRHISKAIKNNQRISICHDCHRFIHRTFTHLELGLHYNKLELLKAHPKVKKFASWAYTQTRKIKF